MNKLVLAVLFGVTIMYSCSHSKKIPAELEKTINNSQAANVGLSTLEVKLSDYSKLVYIDVNCGTDGTGEKNSPFRSINKALSSLIKVDATNRIALFVANGTYLEPTIQMVSWVDLFGGYSSKEWKRDVISNATVLSGIKGNRILIGSNNCTIDGFTFCKALYQGKGSAIYCDGTSPTISNNSFTINKTQKPNNFAPKLWHETANDGGAIYFTNGASPIISNNLFAENSTENGRGAAIACDVKCKPEITNNVFIDNTTGLDDLMRSSDGGAVSIFDRCNAKVENNYFLGNKALSKNDAGGIFIALWSSAILANNVFVDNSATDDAGAIFVGGQEHRYDGPLDPIPSKEEFFVSITNNTIIGNHNSSMNSGAMRFTMESRGTFSNNKTAFNNGIYFQRSEVAVINNIILDNFLFIETKEGLKPGSITDNIIWGKYDQQVKAKVDGNYIRDGKNEEPKFLDDGKQLMVISSVTNSKTYITEILTSNSGYPTDKLAGRVVKFGDNWGIVKSNHQNTIEVWGNLMNSSVLSILPTYTIVKK